MSHSNNVVEMGAFRASKHAVTLPDAAQIAQAQDEGNFAITGLLEIMAESFVTQIHQMGYELISEHTYSPAGHRQCHYRVQAFTGKVSPQIRLSVDAG